MWIGTGTAIDQCQDTASYTVPTGFFAVLTTVPAISLIYDTTLPSRNLSDVSSLGPQYKSDSRDMA
jgi:hypothetical protein